MFLIRVLKSSYFYSLLIPGLKTVCHLNRFQLINFIAGLTYTLDMFLPPPLGGLHTPDFDNHQRGHYGREDRK